MNDIETRVEELLKASNISYEIISTGAQTRDDNWECDGWKITFHTPSHQRETFEYYTGIGHRKLMRPIPYSLKNSPYTHASWKKEYSKPVKPPIAGLLYSIVLDGMATEMCFMDWAEDMGMSSDSIKAIKIYNECCEQTKKFQRLAGFPLYNQLKEVLQDY